jgi:hypothetical protein
MKGGIGHKVDEAWTLCVQKGHPRSASSPTAEYEIACSRVSLSSEAAERCSRHRSVPLSGQLTLGGGLVPGHFAPGAVIWSVGLKIRK